MSQHNKINYLEIPAKDLAKTKSFFSVAFGWDFVDYGPEYCAITGAGIDGGFYLSDKTVTTQTGSVLVVMYSDDLESSEQQVVSAGGEIIKAIFSFPGGRRFHFADPNGNEFAIWSDK